MDRTALSGTFRCGQPARANCWPHATVRQSRGGSGGPGCIKSPASLAAHTGQERIQYLFKLKALLEANLDEIGRTITLECGKTLEEATGEMRRAIEMSKWPAGSDAVQGGIVEDIARV